MLLAAILITNHWAWWRFYERPLIAWRLFGVTNFHSEFPFIAFGVLAHVLSWVNSLRRAHGFKFKEFIAVIVSGGFGGWLLWLGATKIFNQPTAVAEAYTCLAVPLFLSFFFLAIMIFAGITSRWTSQTGPGVVGPGHRLVPGFGIGWIVLAVWLFSGHSFSTGQPRLSARSPPVRFQAP